jgi:hypothetical protein
MAITYPVSSTDRFVFYRISTQDILRKNVKWPRADGQPINSPDPDIGPAIMVFPAAPAYDPATEKLTQQGVLDAPNETYTVNWVIVALTAQEQAEYAEQQALNTKLVNLETAIATLRQWALDAQGVTVTSGNAVAVLQQVVDRSGVFYDKFADLLETQRAGKYLESL